MLTRTELRAMPKTDLEHVVYNLETKLANMEHQKEKDLVKLVPVLEELDTVGFICGGGSKKRAKDKLNKYLVDNYGENYLSKYKELTKDIKKEEEKK